jgi:signal transduction histidine kinase
MEEILVSLIIQLCRTDSRDYKIQNEYTDCHHYTINCALNRHSELTEQNIRKCTNDKHKAIRLTE